MTHTMNRRPLLLTGPYLAMWLWLIVPLTLHGFVPVPSGQVSLHIGGWMEELDGADTLGEALRIMRKDRVYSQCRTVRFEADRVAIVVLPPKGQHCALLRLTRPGKGRVVRSATYAQIIDELRNN